MGRGLEGKCGSKHHNWFKLSRMSRRAGYSAYGLRYVIPATGRLIDSGEKRRSLIKVVSA